MDTNATNEYTPYDRRADLQMCLAFKAFELMTAIKNGVLILSPSLSKAQRGEANRELWLIDRDIKEFMADYEKYFATVHFSPPSEYDAEMAA